MRYAVKFNNGAWKTFDSVNYTDVGIHGLKREAQDYVDYLNRKQASK